MQDNLSVFNLLKVEKSFELNFLHSTHRDTRISHETFEKSTKSLLLSFKCPQIFTTAFKARIEVNTKSPKAISEKK
jgi:hypothetical protein